MGIAKARRAAILLTAIGMGLIALGVIIERPGVVGGAGAKDFSPLRPDGNWPYHLALGLPSLSPALGRAPDQPATPPPSPDMRPRGYFPFAARSLETKDPITRAPLPSLGACTRELVSSPAGYLDFYDVAVDGRGTTWFATNRGAFGELADGARLTLRNADGLASEEARAIAIDVGGNPWFGTAVDYRYPNGDTYEAGGLSGYHYPAFLTWRNTGDAGPGTFGQVEDLAVDSRNTKWLVMGIYRLRNSIDWGGVYSLSEDRKWTFFPNAAGADLSEVDRVVVDAFDNLWFDGWGTFVLRQADGAWTRDLGPGAPDAREVTTVATDPTRRQVWLVSEFDRNVRLHVRDADGPWRAFDVPRDGDRGGLGAHTLGVDARGNAWFASEVQAGVRWAGGRWEWFPESDALGGYISWIVVDARGVVWLQVDSSSLVRVDCR